MVGEGQFGHQINGLLEFSRSWDELTKFVNKQKTRDWQNKQSTYGKFYAELDQQLRDLQQLAKDQFVSGEMSKSELRERTQVFAGLIAGEFIQTPVCRNVVENGGEITMRSYSFERRYVFSGVLVLKTALHIGSGWIVAAPATRLWCAQQTDCLWYPVPVSRVHFAAAWRN